jgi:hypothetical protein
VGTIASLSDLVNRLSGGSSGTPENLWVYRTSRISGTADTTPAAGRWHSAWRWDGIPSGGAAPGASVLIPTNATTGALKQTDPGGGRAKYLVGAGGGGLAAGVWLLYDRLLHISSLSGTNTGAQTVAGSLTRETTGAGVQAWVEIYSAIGGTARTITASYTNQAGTAGQTSAAVAIGGTGLLESSRMIQLPLAAGDTGVRAVASVTLSATTGTAGDFGVTLMKPLAMIHVPATGTGTWRSYVDGYSIPEIKTGACLALTYLAATTTVTDGFAALAMVEA